MNRIRRPTSKVLNVLHKGTVYTLMFAGLGCAAGFLYTITQQLSASKARREYIQQKKINEDRAAPQIEIFEDEKKDEK